MNADNQDFKYFDGLVDEFEEIVFCVNLRPK
jgi:hypothetical protein